MTPDDIAPDDEANETPVLAPEEEIRALKDQLAAETDKRLRTLAETDNLKKRLLKEKEESIKFAAEGVLADLLPVLDNLELALAHGRPLEACQDVVMGVDMTRKIFLDILARHGLTTVGLAGEAFNPELHEAVGVKPPEPGSDISADHILQVVQTGYMLRGRLLRPAKVLVCKE